MHAKINVSDNKHVWAQTCTSFYYSTNKCTGGWCCGSTPKQAPKDGLPNQEDL